MIERVLIPTDFSESSRHALKYAVDLNKLLGLTARLYLLHVLQDFTEVLGIRPEPHDPAPALCRVRGKRAKRLEEW